MKTDVIKHYPDNIYISSGRELYTNGRRITGLSLDELIDNYRQFVNNRKENTLLQDSYRHIDVINPNADNVAPSIPDNSITFKQLRDVLNEHVHKKTIVMKPDFSEICLEYYRIEHHGMRISVVFDLDLLYDKYDTPDVKKIYKTDAFMGVQSDIGMLGFDLIIIDDYFTHKPEDIVQSLNGYLYFGIHAVSILDPRQRDHYSMNSADFYPLPVASLIEFNPKTDFNVNRFRKDVIS